MTEDYDALGPTLGWRGALVPARAELRGRHVTLLPLDPRQHAGALFDATHGEPRDAELWRYLPYGPFPDAATFETWLWRQAGALDPIFYAVVPTGAAPTGLASFLRIDANAGVIEIGHLLFGPSLQRTRAATEAIRTLVAYAFETLGYRRVEWKCNANNARSRRAAERFGFTFEGVFRQARVDRDRNRDHAWYSIIDEEWPMIARAFHAWLDDDNFDAEGRQRRALAARGGMS